MPFSVEIYSSPSSVVIRALSRTPDATKRRKVLTIILMSYASYAAL